MKLLSLILALFATSALAVDIPVRNPSSGGKIAFNGISTQTPNHEYVANNGSLPGVNATDTTHSVAGSSGVLLLNYTSALGTSSYEGARVTWANTIQATDRITLEFSIDGGTTWVDSSGMGYTPNIASTNYTGAWVVAVDSTHTDVRFYAYATPFGGTLGWNTAYRWRLHKQSF